jgi:glutathione S-transferase
MITLYGSARNRGGRCILALEECGLRYELRDLDLQAGEHKKPEYLRLNPNGKVPTLVDGDTVVWESMAINIYLAERYGKTLMPSSAAGRAHVVQWSMWALATLEPHLATIFSNRVMLPESQRNAAAADASAKQAAELLAVLDHALEGRDFLVGDTFTIADVNVGHEAAWANLVGVDMSGVPKVRRWFGALAARPSFAKLVERPPQAPRA